MPVLSNCILKKVRAHWLPPVEIWWSWIQTCVLSLSFVRGFQLCRQYGLPCFELTTLITHSLQVFKRIYPLTLCFLILIRSFPPPTHTVLLFLSKIIQQNLLILFLKYIANSFPSFFLLRIRPGHHHLCSGLSFQLVSLFKSLPSLLCECKTCVLYMNILSYASRQVLLPRKIITTESYLLIYV